MVISATLRSPTGAIQKYQNPGFKKYVLSKYYAA